MRMKLPKPRSRAAAAAYAAVVGLAAAAVATAGRALLGFIAPDMVPYPLVFPAVLFATLVAGPGAGCVAAAAGLIAADYFFVPPIFTFVTSLTQGLGLATLAGSSLLLIWLADRYRKTFLARAREREGLITRQFQFYERSQTLMFVVAGTELSIDFANPTFLGLIGRESVVGKRLLDVLPETEAAFVEALHEVGRTGKAAVGRGELAVPQDGGRRTIDFVAQPIFAEEGSVQAVFVEAYDVTDKVETEGRFKLVVQEIDHRANNLLAVVLSIVRLSKGESPGNLQQNIIGRVDALARAHQLLSDAGWRGGDLRRLILEELLPYTLGEPSRSLLQGPPMNLNAGEAQAMAMGIHELATNAAKYGALSTPDGRIEVSWNRDSGGARHIRWQEDGGPPVTPPDQKGFGTRVLERALQGLGGSTRLVWRSEGLICEFDLPPEPPAVQLWQSPAPTREVRPQPRG
jgi:PAS domain S-box-containing protein